jgi:hypothetical protein
MDESRSPPDELDSRLQTNPPHQPTPMLGSCKGQREFAGQVIGTGQRKLGTFRRNVGDKASLWLIILA